MMGTLFDMIVGPWLGEVITRNWKPWVIFLVALVLLLGAIAMIIWG